MRLLETYRVNLKSFVSGDKYYIALLNFTHQMFYS